MRASKILGPALVASALAVGGQLLAVPPALAGGGACPASPSRFRSWDVATQPYQADNASDVNGDGWGCARPTKNTFAENGQTFTVYLFVDDNVRA
jgi:hypothetical protein